MSDYMMILYRLAVLCIDWGCFYSLIFIFGFNFFKHDDK